VKPPPAGSIYVPWLTGEGQEPLRLAKLTFTGDAINYTFTHPQGHNLLGLFNGMFISVERLNDADPAPSEVKAYQGEVPAAVMEQVRLAVVASPHTPNGDGPALNALSQIFSRIEPEVGFQRDYSIPNDDLAALKIQAEGIINNIEGESGPNYGDTDGNGEIYDQGNGFGLLGSGEGAGYLQAVINHAVAASQAEGASPETILRAQQTQAAAQNSIRLAEQIRDLELQILQASDIASAAELVNRVVELTQSLTDTDGVNLTDPGQGGVRAMYTYGQLMGSIEIFAVGNE
jgi:hypothetical protein